MAAVTQYTVKSITPATCLQCLAYEKIKSVVNLHSTIYSSRFAEHDGVLKRTGNAIVQVKSCEIFVL